MKQTDFISLLFNPKYVRAAQEEYEDACRTMNPAAGEYERRVRELQATTERQFEINQQERKLNGGGFLNNLHRIPLPLKPENRENRFEEMHRNHDQAAEHVVRAVTSEYERRIDSMRAQIQQLEAERDKPVEMPEIEPAIKEKNVRKIRL